MGEAPRRDRFMPRIDGVCLPPWVGDRLSVGKTLMLFQKPRLVIAALRGGSGKTLVSLGLVAAWRREYGLRVIPFKKGPDYIDAGWLSLAAGGPCYNLDPFLMNPGSMLDSFVRRSLSGDCSVIEGNRGLYDGVDTQGTYSTAELAKFLKAPVVLVLDGTKVTRTAAALVLGCQKMDPEVRIAGVVLNHVAGKRHERVLRGSIESFCGVPVLGVIPKQAANFFPERHLGLVPYQEAANSIEAMDHAARMAKGFLDLEALLQLAKGAEPLGMPLPSVARESVGQPVDPPVIGVLRDAAFQFYYPENLEALEECGAVLKEISSFEKGPLPRLDALYAGGGFPETHLEILAENQGFRESLKTEIEAGLPVYAECGGLMFLCREILHGDKAFPMAGVFPYSVVMESKPQGHGYVVMECAGWNPYFPVGAELKGHEFHYSRIVGPDAATPFVFKLTKGHGIVAGRDGLCYKNALASYAHIHSAGGSGWADAMVAAASRHKLERSRKSHIPQGDAERRMTGKHDYLTAV